MQEKEYIPQMYATTLKDLGFDDVCIGSAPLWQQAFEFFRYRYGLDNACMKDRYMVERNGKFPAYYKADSYEDAKEKCLNKLIKIVSNGKFNR